MSEISSYEKACNIKICTACDEILKPISLKFESYGNRNKFC